MSEHSEQAALVAWARMSEGIYPELRWLYSSLNGIPIPAPDKIRFAIMNRMKSEGMKKGVSDLCLPVALGGYHGMYIEMKKDHRSEIKQEQVEFLDFLAEQGYLGIRCNGFEHARNELVAYLSLPK